MPPQPAISSVVLRDTIAGYTQEYTNFSSTVEPLSGQQFINPGEEFILELTATNDPYFAGSGGVRLVNVRWHVAEVGAANPPTVSILVPGPPLEGRAGPTDDLPLLTAGDHVAELHVFPKFGKSVLEPGETDVIELRGFAEAAGTIQIQFNLLADVDPDGLDLADQSTYSVAAGGTAQVVT